MQSLVVSDLDYANSVLYGLPIFTIKHLQILQNRAANHIEMETYRSFNRSSKTLKLATSLFSNQLQICLYRF
jgi:hypothetical protein